MDPILKEERREMKKLKAHCDMLDYVCYTQEGIPTSCPCGGRIINEKSPEETSDTLPGKRFFTCDVYKADGLHYRQPWVLGVQQEIAKLVMRVEEGEKLKWEVHDMSREIKKLINKVQELEDEVWRLTGSNA